MPKRQIVFNLLMGFLLVSMIGCGTKKTAVGSMKKLTDANVKKVLLNHHRPYTYFHGKAKAEASENGNGMGFTATIRMKKKEYLWMAISKLGFEVARAYITPDSAFVIDRFHKEYYKEELKSYLAEYQIPFSFEELQGMFIGQVPLPKENNFVVDFQEPNYLVSSNNRLKGMFEYVLDGTTQQISEARFIESSRGRKVNTSLSGYATIDEKLMMPHNISHIASDGTSEAELIIRYSEMVFDEEKSVPFEIPAHYVKVE